MSALLRPSTRLRYRVILLAPWFRHPVLRMKVALAVLLPGGTSMMGIVALTDVHDAAVVSHVTLVSMPTTGGLRADPEAGATGALPVPEPTPDLPASRPAGSVMRWPAWPEVARPDTQKTDGRAAPASSATRPLPLLQPVPVTPWRLAVTRPKVDEAEIQTYLLGARNSLSRGQSVQAREQLQAVLGLDPARIEALEQLWQLSRQDNDRQAERNYADRLQQLLPDYFVEDTLPAAIPQEGLD